MPRPRKHPEGTTSTQRVLISDAALIASGGSRKQFRLSGEANRALKLLANANANANANGVQVTELSIIENLLLSEIKRLIRRQKKNDVKRKG